MVKYLAATVVSLAIAIIPKPAVANWAIANQMGAAGCTPEQAEQAPNVSAVLLSNGFTQRLAPVLILYMGASRQGVYNVINSSNPAVVKDLIVVTCLAVPPLGFHGEQYDLKGNIVYSTPTFWWERLAEFPMVGISSEPVRIYHLRRVGGTNDVPF